VNSGAVNPKGMEESDEREGAADNKGGRGRDGGVDSGEDGITMKS